jgi:hypothetical protein
MTSGMSPIYSWSVVCVLMTLYKPEAQAKDSQLNECPSLALQACETRIRLTGHYTRVEADSVSANAGAHFIRPQWTQRLLNGLP